MAKNKIILVSLALSGLICGCVPTNTVSKAKSKKATEGLNPSGNLAPPIGHITNGPVDTCPANSSGETDYCQIFHQKAGGTNSAIDILWVVDNSGSMRDEQNSLAQNFETFINKFANQALQTDFRMAIITTSTPDNRVAKGKLTDESLNADRYAFINYFKEKIKVGLNGNDDEKGLLTSEVFLKQNSDWPRQNAYLMAIYISDQDDTSCLEYSDSTGYINRDLSDDTFTTYRYKECLYVNHGTSNALPRDETIKLVSNYYFRSITGTIPGKNEHLFKAFAITSKPEPGDSFGWGKGYKYEKMTEITGGKTYSIGDSFEDILNDFGQKTAEIASQFQLKYPAQENSIEVYVGGVSVPQGDWEYLASERAIRFEKNALPKAGNTIKVVYQTQ